MNKKQIKRFFIIVIPVVLSFLFLFSPFEEIPVAEEITENSRIVKVLVDGTFKPSLKTTLRDILEVPFDLKWYDICFVNNDTKLIYESGEIDKNVNISLKFNNQTEYNIPYGKTKCITYKFDEDFTYENEGYGKRSVNILMHVPSSVFDGVEGDIQPFAKLHYGVSVYAKLKLRDAIVKNILVLFAWSGLLFLWFNILDYIKFGRKNKTYRSK